MGQWSSGAFICFNDILSSLDVRVLYLSSFIFISMNEKHELMILRCPELLEEIDKGERERERAREDF